MKRPPSGVAPACTGWAISAAELTTTKSSSAIVDDTITTRRRPRRPTRTSPARPEAASTPISATQATPRAKIAFSHFGASPSSTESAIAPASKNWTNAIHAHRHQHDDRGERHAQHRSQPARRDAADVDRCHEQQREPGDQHLDEAVVDARREHGQVVGDDDRTRRHHDQVVEQDRPAGDEAPELVEGVARERRGAAALDVERGALDVGGHRDGEEEPGDHVDERRQPERVAGDDAEREEHRRDDGAQRDGEQRGLAQPARDPQPRTLGALAQPLARPQRRPDAGVAHSVRPRASSAGSRVGSRRAAGTGRAARRRVAPAASPSSTPTASAPPPPASATTIITSPSTSSATLSTRVVAR